MNKPPESLDAEHQTLWAEIKDVRSSQAGQEVKECLKLLAFVIVVLAVPIVALQGCLSTEVRIINDDIACVMTESKIGLGPEVTLWDNAKVDCSLWNDAVVEKKTVTTRDGGDAGREDK